MTENEELEIFNKEWNEGGKSIIEPNSTNDLLGGMTLEERLTKSVEKLTSIFNKAIKGILGLDESSSPPPVISTGNSSTSPSSNKGLPELPNILKSENDKQPSSPSSKGSLTTLSSVKSASSSCSVDTENDTNLLSKVPKSISVIEYWLGFKNSRESDDRPSSDPES